MELFVCAPGRFRFSCSVFPGGSVVQDVLNRFVQQRDGSPPDFYVSRDGRITAPEDPLQHGAVYHLEPRLCGGKGGFGSMLRALGAQIEKTTNREACRDLSGRRLRDVNHEKEMAEWLKKQAEREAEKEQRRLERLQRKLAEPKHQFTDGEYQRQCHDLSERLEDSVLKGLQVKVDNVSVAKRPNSDLSEVPDRKKKKMESACFWTGMGELDELLSSEEEDEEDYEPPSTSAAASCSGAAAKTTRGVEPEQSSSSEATRRTLRSSDEEETSESSCSSQQLDEDSGDHHHQSDEEGGRHLQQPDAEEDQGHLQQPDAEEDQGHLQQPDAEEDQGHLQQPDAEEDQGHQQQPDAEEDQGHQQQPDAEEDQGHQQQPDAEEDQGHQQQPDAEEDQGHQQQPDGEEGEGGHHQPEAALCLSSVLSVQQLESLGLDVLKQELISRGLKCGGTLTERATRLFSVRGLRAEQIDPALLAKPSKAKRK
ncbi:splicing regulator SDE2 isoform 1-T1 [Aulostomus maculatus]